MPFCLVNGSMLSSSGIDFIARYRELAAAGKPIVAQQLAQESGYHSYSTFSAAFKQRMHKNVTDWMREEVFLQKS